MAPPRPEPLTPRLPAPPRIDVPWPPARCSSWIFPTTYEYKAWMPAVVFRWPTANPAPTYSTPTDPLNTSQRDSDPTPSTISPPNPLPTTSLNHLGLATSATRSSPLKVYSGARPAIVSGDSEKIMGILRHSRSAFYQVLYRSWREPQGMNIRRGISLMRDIVLNVDESCGAEIVGPDVLGSSSWLGLDSMSLCGIGRNVHESRGTDVVGPDGLGSIASVGLGFG